MRVVEKLATNHRRFHEITLDEVAEAAKVGKGTIYHYFKDKEDLLFQVATSGFDELCELFQQKIQGNGSFSEKLLNVCKEIEKFFAARRELVRIMQSEAALVSWREDEIRQRWLAKQKILIDALANVLSDGVAEGAIRADIPASVLATFLFGMLRTRARGLDNNPDDKKDYYLLVELFLNGVHLPSESLSLNKMPAKKSMQD